MGGRAAQFTAYRERLAEKYMIACDPRNAPRLSWWLGYRWQGIKYWIALFFPLGRFRVPWCGWDQFWECRPWR
jgi:hypothetical protein